MKIVMAKEVKNLAKWLENNPASKMAYLLGYSNSNVVTMWVQRRNIPEYQVFRVRQIINNEGVENERQQFNGTR